MRDYLPVENFLSAFGFLGALGVLAWYLHAHEAHWCSKDGSRFTCRVHVINEQGTTQGRWREARAIITSNGMVSLRLRGLSKREIQGVWTVTGAAPDPPKGKNLFLLRQSNLVVLRVPSTSRCIAPLDALFKSAS